jgi:predicted RNA-binding protein with PUA-like domain
MANRWLVKTEPSAYSFADLVREKRTVWDGVANAAAQRHLAAMKRGDEVLVYHTGGERAVVGLARVVEGPRPDPAAGNPRVMVVTLAPVRALVTPVPLAALKARKELAGWDLVRLPRASVLPVPPQAWEAVAALGG